MRIQVSPHEDSNAEDDTTTARRSIHIAPQQPYPQRDDGLADPHHGEDAAEDERALIVASVKT